MNNKNDNRSRLEKTQSARNAGNTNGQRSAQSGAQRNRLSQAQSNNENARKVQNGQNTAKRNSGSAANTNTQKRTYNTQSRSTTSDSAQFLTLNKKTVTVAVVVVLVIMNIFAFSAITQRSIPEKQTPDMVAKNSRLELESNTESPFETATVTSSDYVRGSLALVNAEYPFNFDYKGTDIKEADIVRVNSLIRDRNFKAADNTILLGTETIEALNLMFADFRAATGKNDVMINSAHRTREQQQSILDKKILQLGADQQIAQTPGNSEHHTGYGFDISIYPDGGVGARTFTGDGEYAWIYENCHKYGFILRYPEGKTDITGIDPESWHFRYVGIPHATYIYEHNITLEEYISEIRGYTENVPLTVELSDTEVYSVYYVRKGSGAATEFNVPKQTDYSISGDNVGGFVVWYNNGETEIGKSDDQSQDTSAADSPENET